MLCVPCVLWALRRAQLQSGSLQLNGVAVDYEATIRFKRSFARQVFDRFGAQTLASHDFQVGAGRRHRSHAFIGWVGPKSSSPCPAEGLPLPEGDVSGAPTRVHAAACARTARRLSLARVAWACVAGWVAPQVWFSQQRGWLQPYAAFCYLKDLFQVRCCEKAKGSKGKGIV